MRRDDYEAKREINRLILGWCYLLALLCLGLAAWLNSRRPHLPPAHQVETR